MNQFNNERRVAWIVLTWGENAITSGPGAWLYYGETYHGDHDEAWIVARNDAQQEVRRYNCRQLAQIEWAPELPEQYPKEKT